MRMCNCVLSSMFGSQVCENCGNKANYVSTKSLEEFKVVKNASEITRKTNASDDLIRREEAIDQLHQSINLLEAEERIKELPTAEQWIPCSERLPHNGDGIVLVNITYPNKAYFPIILCSSENAIRMAEHGDVNAWMPLPTPYKGDE